MKVGKDNEFLQNIRMNSSYLEIIKTNKGYGLIKKQR